MKLACTAAEVRELDRRMIADLGLPGAALMEVAARGVAESIRRHHDSARKKGVVVACGSGNNGGDGWAVARWLHGWGWPVAVIETGPPADGTDAALHRGIALRAGVTQLTEWRTAGLVVDAVFGTGLSRAVEGRAADLLRRVGAQRAEIVAVDLPSGLDADTGVAQAVCPWAVRTVTMGRAKLGMWLRDGPERCGTIEVVDLGYDAVPDAGALATAEIPDASDLEWPRRKRTDHKRKSGHLLVVAGSAAMAGAAILACKGALAAGAGLVTLCAPRGARGRFASLPAEVMVLEGGPGDRLERLPEDLRAYDAIAAGPGLGAREPLPERLASDLTSLWRSDRRAAVFDADALPCTGPTKNAQRVLTPHAGEAGRLLGIDASTVEADRVGWARHLAERGTVVLKGPSSLVATEGRRVSINPTGGPVLASGGTGDVLTGILGALLARGVPAPDAARLATFVHGLAADRLAARREHGWRATDVAKEIPAAVAAIGG